MSGAKNHDKHAKFRSIFMYVTSRNAPIQSASEIPQEYFDAVAERGGILGVRGLLEESIVNNKAVETGGESEE